MSELGSPTADRNGNVVSSPQVDQVANQGRACPGCTTYEYDAANQLNREVLLDDGMLAKLLDRALSRYRALLENIAAGGYGEGEVQALLHEQQCQAELETDCRQDSFQLLND